MSTKRKFALVLLMVFLVGMIASFPIAVSAAGKTYTVKVTSNLFGEHTQTYDATTRHITVVYELNRPGYAIVNTDLEFTYDSDVLTYNRSENSDETLSPAAGSNLLCDTPASTFGEEGIITGNFSNVNNKIKAYGANGSTAVLFKVVLDVKDGAQKDTVVNLKLKNFRICDEGKLPETNSEQIVKGSTVQATSGEISKLNLNDYSKGTVLPGDSQPETDKLTVKVTSNLFGEDTKTYTVPDTKKIAVVYELNYPGYAIVNADLELTYDPNVLTYNRTDNTAEGICPPAGSQFVGETPDSTFGEEGIVTGNFSNVANKIKAYNADGTPVVFFTVVFDVKDGAYGLTTVNLNVKRFRICDETKLPETNSVYVVSNSEVKVSDSELAKLNLNDYSKDVTENQPHVHTVVIDKAVAATCTKTGLTEGSHCSVCGEIIKAQEVVPKKAHTVVVDKAVAATCTETGLTEGSHCSVCHTVIKAQETVPKTGHTVVVDKAVAATCTKTGLTEGSHCSVCHTVIKAQEVVPKTGHTVVVDPAVPATCHSTGLTEGSHCSVCNTVIKAQKTVAKLQHKVVTDKAVAPTCTDIGWTEGSHCSLCGDVIKKQEIIPAKGHSEVIDESVPATCTHTGLTTGVHCSVCNKIIIKQNVIPKLDHTVVIDKAVEPTCTKAGLTEGSHCSVCNTVIKKQQSVPALGHNYEIVPAVPATKDHTGLTEGIQCTRCHKWLKEQQVTPKLGTEVLIGDVNMDGEVNGADAGILSRYASGWKNYDKKILNWEAADVNRDGNVNGADAGLLSRYASGWKGYDKYIIKIVV